MGFFLKYKMESLPINLIIANVSLVVHFGYIISFSEIKLKSLQIIQCPASSLMKREKGLLKTPQSPLLGPFRQAVNNALLEMHGYLPREDCVKQLRFLDI